MKELYLLIKNRIAEVQELETVDWYTGQDEQLGDQVIRVARAAYIEFLPLDWEMLGGRVQRALAEFEIRFVQTHLLDGDQPVVDGIANHFGIASDIYKKLQSWEGLLSDLSGMNALAGTANDFQLINSIDRTAFVPQHNLSNLWVTVQRFQATVYDYNAVKAYQQVTANLNLNVNV